MSVSIKSDPATLPLLAGAELDAPIARRGGRTIVRSEYLAHVETLAATLPAGRYGLNLCEDRYLFMVAFAAMLLAGRTNLLPHSAAPRAIAELADTYRAFRIEDADVHESATGAARSNTVPMLSAVHEAAVLFTSGSTGRPKAQVKSWAELVGSAEAALRRFGLRTDRHDIVATVPPQHSYGFESSILYALRGPAAIHAGRPLFPADVRTALAAMRAPRILVTTPLHLAVCLRSGLDWPPVSRLLSATAPLARRLAEAAEKTFRAPLLEIYGSSETGAIASRRTRMDSAWKPYDGVRLSRSGEEFWVHAPYMPQARAISDRLALGDDGRFEWQGRRAEQVKVAGKRTTLGELDRALLAVAGVEDGGFVLSGEEGGRLAAVVVAPKLGKREIRTRLAESLDPVFLPRPLVKVRALPRTATGKLARGELVALVAAHSNKEPAPS